MYVAASTDNFSEVLFLFLILRSCKNPFLMK